MNAIQPSGLFVGLPSDWTCGSARIEYQDCSACGQLWYFARHFCPGCGNPAPTRHVASGLGTVYAATVVHRAPSAALAAHVPYTLVLVDANEGFRLMAHGETGVIVGDAVRASYRLFGDVQVPYFTKYPSHEQEPPRGA